jgi:MFS family permease
MTTQKFNISGYLQDLVGRRTITLVGSIIIMIGVVLIGSAQNFAQAVTGMALSGAGAAVCELTALAGYVPHRFQSQFEAVTKIPLAFLILFL